MSYVRAGVGNATGLIGCFQDITLFEENGTPVVYPRPYTNHASWQS